ncbi:MAG TPA: hypothetical protein VGH33_22310, partial [Isosphaeraceae bacterium]
PRSTTTAKSCDGSGRDSFDAGVLRVYWTQLRIGGGGATMAGVDDGPWLVPIPADFRRCGLSRVAPCHRPGREAYLPVP